jgi:LeuA allosteric (dimerisation) domain
MRITTQVEGIMIGAGSASSQAETLLTAARTSIINGAVTGPNEAKRTGQASEQNNVVQRARELGLELDPDGPLAREISAKVKELESEGLHFEDAAASFELLVRRVGETYEPPFEVTGYDVTSRKSGSEEATSSVASAEVSVGGEVLRGDARGGGPVDALEQALRNALLPAYPHLARVSLTDFRAQISRESAAPHAPVRVWITASAEGSRPWTTVASAPDLLHAVWLALADCLEFAIVTRAGVTATRPPERVTTAIPLAELAPQLAPSVDEHVLRRLAETDWRETALDLDDPGARAFATSATALGAALFYSFGNFCAIAAHPDRRSVVRVNLLKGRPENQVGSVTTTRDRVEALFDWTELPAGLTREQVVALMDDFFELGPMGFRGPARAAIPPQVATLEGEIRTTQLIAPGYRCPSNELLAAVLDRTGVDHLFITSANVSSGVTGKVEPAHPARDAGRLRRLRRHRRHRPPRRAARAGVLPAPPADVDLDSRLPQAGARRGRAAGADPGAARLAARGRRPRARRAARFRPLRRPDRARAATHARRRPAARLVLCRPGRRHRHHRGRAGDQGREHRPDLHPPGRWRCRRVRAARGRRLAPHLPARAAGRRSWSPDECRRSAVEKPLRDRVAAVDRERHAGDKVGRARGEEDRRADQIVRLTPASGRRAAADLVPARGGRACRV